MDVLCPNMGTKMIFGNDIIHKLTYQITRLVTSRYDSTVCVLRKSYGKVTKHCVKSEKVPVFEIILVRIFPHFD